MRHIKRTRPWHCLPLMVSLIILTWAFAVDMDCITMGCHGCERAAGVCHIERNLHLGGDSPGLSLCHLAAIYTYITDDAPVYPAAGTANFRGLTYHHGSFVPVIFSLRSPPESV